MLLRAAGQRVTKPRTTVLAALVAAGSEHLTAEELLERVGGPVHRATVYRTLEGLAEVGLVAPVRLGRGITAYHVAHRAHLHAQCDRCGRVVDVPAAALDDTTRRLRTATGFRLDGARATLPGLCADCADA